MLFEYLVQNKQKKKIIKLTILKEMNIMFRINSLLNDKRETIYRGFVDSSRPYCISGKDNISILLM